MVKSTAAITFRLFSKYFVIFSIKQNTRKLKSNSSRNKIMNEVQNNGNGTVKPLFAFDFDHTIVDKNSDVDILTISPNPLPEDIKKLYNGTNWTHYMDKIFEYLRSQGVGLKEITKQIRSLAPTNGMNIGYVVIFKKK